MYGLPANFPLTAPPSSISGSQRFVNPLAGQPPIAGTMMPPMGQVFRRPALAAPGGMSPLVLQHVMGLLQRMRGVPPAGIQAFQGQPPGAPQVPRMVGMGGMGGGMIGAMGGMAPPQRSSMFSLY